MFDGKKYWLKQKLGLTNVQKLWKAEKSLHGRPFTVEIDGKRVSFCKRPVRDGKLLWGDGVPPTELGDSLVFSDSQKPVYLCIRGVPFSVNPNKAFTYTDSGAVLINWREFGFRLSTLIDSLDVAAEYKARMELVGMKKKPKIKKEWVMALLVLGLVAVIAYVVFVNPHLVPGLMKGFSQSTTGILRPK